MADPMVRQLTILLDGLQEKEQALSEIVNITDNQRTVIESGLDAAAVREFLMEMNKVKQGFIETVKRCDNMFEEMLKDVGPELDAKQHLYKKQVADMQKHIRKIMALDVQVRTQEEENNALLLALSPPDFSLTGRKPKPVAIPPDSALVIKAYEEEKRFRG